MLADVLPSTAECPCPNLQAKKHSWSYTPIHIKELNEEESMKLTLQCNYGNTRGGIRMTNQWWNVQSWSQTETLRRINQNFMNWEVRHVLYAHILYILERCGYLSQKSSMKPSLKRGKLHSNTGDNWSFDGTITIRSSEMHDNWCQDNQFFYFMSLLVLSLRHDTDQWIRAQSKTRNSQLWQLWKSYS